jgi:Kef-type K+ transport system membrane component KefB
MPWRSPRSEWIVALKSRFTTNVIRMYPAIADRLGDGPVIVMILGKAIAAAIAGRAFGYSRPARLTMWALTLPQVAATLAATLVGYNTLNAAGERLLSGDIFNAVLVLLVVTSVLSTILTEVFIPGMAKEETRTKAAVT